MFTINNGLGMPKPLRNHMSHMKFKETVESYKLFKDAILDFTLKIYVPLNTFWYIFKILLPDDLEIRLKRFHNYCNLCRVTPSFVTGCPD